MGFRKGPVTALSGRGLEWPCRKRALACFRTSAELLSLALESGSLPGLTGVTIKAADSALRGACGSVCLDGIHRHPACRTGNTELVESTWNDVAN